VTYWPPFCLGHTEKKRKTGKICWLLINQSLNLPTATPFAQRYRIFSDPEAAYRATLQVGFSDTFFGGLQHPRDMKLGFMQCFKHHPIDVSLIMLEEEEAS
jgi:hypothetical protein